MSIFRRSKDKDAQGQAAPAFHDNDSEKFFREVDIEFLIHELKDPVAIIETGLRTLLERREKYGPLTAKQDKTLHRTLRNTKKARAMLNNLLEIGRSQAGCFMPCQFNPAKSAYRALSDALETMAWGVFEQFCTYETKDDALKYLSKQGIFFSVDPTGTKP